MASNEIYPEYVRAMMNANYVEIFDLDYQLLFLGAGLEAMEKAVDSNWTKSVTSELIPALKNLSLESGDSCWISVVR